MTSPLEHFLNPKSAAIIGVSPNWSYINTIFKHFVALKKPGRVYPINPRYPDVDGVKCYHRLTDVPDDVELVLVAVPVRLVPDALEQCEQKKVKAINIITSGFAEIGGEEGDRRHKMMTDFVERTGIRIVGPNCYGNASAIYRFAGMPNTALMCQRAGRLSLAFQSGGIAISVISNCVDRYIDIAHVLSTGNEVDLDVADCVRYFAEDDNTQVVGCYVEQFRKPEAFLEAAELCAAARKPIVVLKSGRSEVGAKMAQAHTGALAGSDKIIDAMLRKYGVTRVYDFNEMIETMAIMHSKKLPKGRGVGALTNSGGENSVLVDLAEEIGVSFPPFSPDSAAIIREELYDYIAVSNPLDITGPGGTADMNVHEAALDGMGSDPSIHIILHNLGGNTKFDAASPSGKVILAAIQKYPDKVWLRSSKVAGTFRDKPLGMPDFAEPRADFEGVPFMQGTTNILKAVKHLIDYAEYQNRRAGIKPAPPVDAARQTKARALVKAAGGRALTESEGKQVLALYGIPVTKEGIAQSADEAARVAQAIGFPVVLKIVSPQIMHKTEAGGVVLNVKSADDAKTAFERITASCKKYNPQAELQGVSVQEMVGGGQEMILGMTRDPQFGPGVLVGLGGIFVEVLKDAALNIPPIDAEGAQAMIDSLRGKAILKGARGLKPSDVGALVQTLQDFSQLCVELKDDVKEIDINPFVVFENGKGAKALDCLIVPA
ncbi:MAG: acetate--CoA ligase family protein [Chloroflexi bacterium]|nr:acetate--CoA ligase family protein [Chloroflexota bacterium]